MSKNEVVKLRDYLALIPPGPIEDTSELERLLSVCWRDFRGGYEEKMDGSKLHGRMEDVEWQPPKLTFVIERHGATVVGSSRAALQHWILNIAELSADSYVYGHRQLYPMEPRLNVKPIAEEIAGLILSHNDDERLKWNGGGSVRVLTGKIIPAGSLCKRTLEGRRGRFWQAMDELLLPSGCKRVRPNVYFPPGAGSDREKQKQ
jgi:hypothetical protein